MKKRALSIALILVMCISLSGCGIFSILKNRNRDDENAAPGASGAATVSSSPIPSADVVPSPEPEVEPVETSSYVAGLQRENLIRGLKKLMVIQEDYSLEEYLEVGEDEIIVGADAKDGEAYALTRVGDGEYPGAFIYYVTEPGKYVVFEVPDEYDNTLDTWHVTIKDGYFYFVYYENLESGSYDQAICRFDGKTGAFSRDDHLTKVARAAKEETPGCYLVNANIAYDLERDGVFYLYESNGYAIMLNDEDGHTNTSAYSDVEMNYVDLIDDGYALVYNTRSDDDGYHKTYYLVNLKTNETREFLDTQGYDGMTAVEVDGDYLYFFFRNSENDMGYSLSYTYCRGRLDGEGEIEEIFTVEGTPATDDYDLYQVPGLGFRSVKGYQYFMCEDGKNMSWTMISADNPEEYSQGPADYSISYKEFGDVWSVAESCEEDPYKYYERYAEYFKFDSSFPNADKLNDILFNMDTTFDEGCENSKKEAYEAIVENADPNDDMQYISAYSDTRTIERVEKLGKHYVQIGIGDFVYWGGAHGMGGVTYTMFDYDSGEVVTIRDLYPGDDESFKKLVTAYTVDAWMNGDDRFYESYESDDPDFVNDFRAQVSEYSDLDLDVRFMEDGFEVLYPPYLLGPYASGTINIFIPYKDAVIDINK